MEHPAYIRHGLRLSPCEICETNPSSHVQTYDGTLNESLTGPVAALLTARIVKAWLRIGIPDAGNAVPAVPASMMPPERFGMDLRFPVTPPGRRPLPRQ